MELATINAGSPYVVALQSTKISEMKKGDVKNLLLDIISKTYYDGGIPMPGTDDRSQTVAIRLLTDALYEELQQFKFLRIEEVRITFKNGVRGEYGEFFGLNIRTFYSWLKAWQFDEKRRAAALALKSANEREYAPVMTDAESERAWKETILRQFTKFKATGVLDCAFPNHLYGVLVQRGLINFTREEKETLLAIAWKQVVEIKKIQRLNPKNRSHLSELADFIRRAEDNTLRDHEKEEMRQHARLLAIKKYYQGIDVLRLEEE